MKDKRTEFITILVTVFMSKLHENVAIVVFQIKEDDSLPNVVCYRCMFNLENFYDFRTACINASAWLQENKPKTKGVSVSIYH